MRRGVGVLVAVLGWLWLALGAVHAADAVVVEAMGSALQAGPADADPARRRALADAIFAAALAGGAEVSGHTVVDRSVVARDLAIVRPVGRVLGHEILSETRNGDLWEVRIRARVGAGRMGDCTARRRIRLAIHPAQVRVSAQAPAWTGPLADEVVQEIIRQADRHPDITILRIADRGLPRPRAGGESFDYAALTRGTLALAPGDHALVPEVRVTAGAAGRGTEIGMEVSLVLVSGAGGESRSVIRRAAKVPDTAVLGRVGVLARPDRARLAASLSKGIGDQIAAALDAEACQPVVARAHVKGGTITVPVGRDHGLSKGSIAFTADRDASVEMLEILRLDGQSARLRPLDPGVPASAFHGRPLRFVETGR